MKMILVYLFGFVIVIKLFDAVVDEHDPWNIFISIMWGSMSYLVAMFVKANAPIFCNRPRLNQPRL